MKTFLSEIRDTERFLRAEMPAADALVFQARTLVNEKLRTNTLLHRVVHRIVHLYHRRMLKAEVQTLHNSLMTDPQKKSFREDLLRLFNE